LSAGSRVAIPTKIEFSRRSLDAGAELAPVDSELLRRYRLYPVLLKHYSAAAAFAQKIAALALRSQRQARDIFDLKLLIDAGAGAVPLPKDRQALLAGAIENALTIGFDEFTGQVVAYLEPEYQADYRERNSWDRLRKQVVESLQALRS
jgi:hypothetical protein